MLQEKFSIIISDIFTIMSVMILKIYTVSQKGTPTLSIVTLRSIDGF